MSYDYETEKAKLFTERGLKMMMDLRESVRVLLAKPGAFTASSVMGTGDSWAWMAGIDFLEREGVMRCVFKDCKWQDRVYTRTP